MPKYCEGKNCSTEKKRAHYNLPGLKAKFCVGCKEEKMINVTKRTCQHEEEPCNTQPSFNFPGKKPGIYCERHKKDDMINVVNRKCQDPECKGNKNAYYNYDGELIAKYCRDHAEENMINIRSKHCHVCGIGAAFCSPDKKIWSCSKDAGDDFICPSAKYCEECGKFRASFNYENEKGPKYCSQHAKPNMIDKTHPRCDSKGCFQSALFNFPSEKPKFCGTHADKEGGMINLHHKKCEKPGCPKLPTYNLSSEKTPILCAVHKNDGMVRVGRLCKKCNKIGANFNFPGHTKPIYCYTHKDDGMICVTKKLCRFSGCPHRPSYNFKGLKNPIFCSTHADSEMIDIRHKKCLECNDRIPHFNFPGEKLGIYCSIHALDGMIDIKNNMCPHEDCSGNKQGLFNFPGEKDGIYCSEHKEDGMVNVKINRCQDSKCSENGKIPITALFGYPGQKVEYCDKHKLDGMIIFPRKRCIHPECQGEIALFGIRSNKAEYCEIHAPKNYVCVIRKKCQGCQLIDVLDKEGFCYTCNPSRVEKFKLAKQKQVVAWLNVNGHDDYLWVDKVPDELLECKEGIKFTYRPDIFYDCGTHFVIVEVDEHQHNQEQYQKCDLPRMINIQQALALPTIFIRYNPDSYKEDKKIVNVGNNKRCKVLCDWLKDAKERLAENSLEVVYLFYDDYQENNVAYQNIDIMKVAKPKLKLTFKK